MLFAANLPAGAPASPSDYSSRRCPVLEPRPVARVSRVNVKPAASPSALALPFSQQVQSTDGPLNHVAGHYVEVYQAARLCAAAQAGKLTTEYGA